LAIEYNMSVFDIHSFELILYAVCLREFASEGEHIQWQGLMHSGTTMASMVTLHFDWHYYLN